MMPAHNKLARRQANLSDAECVGPIVGTSRIQAAVGQLAAAVFLLSLLPTAAAHGQGMVGETRCGNPTCHGASLPSAPADDPTWKPWKSARTQWLNSNIDRHSRAYRTLTSEDSKRIAAYMGIEATKRRRRPRRRGASTR